METSDVLIRDITPDDIHGGLLESLDALRPTGGSDPRRMSDICGEIIRNPDYVVAVAVYGDRVVGAATLLVERKLIHNGGLAGHIEDVAVSVRHQGHGIGTKLVEYLLEEARRRGCYRTTLDCEERLVGFYTRMGFERCGVHMRVSGDSPGVGG